MSHTEIPGTHEEGFVEFRIVELVVPPAVKQLNPLFSLYQMGECSIIKAREKPTASDEALWHLSISRTDRHPSWDEIKTARYRLLPHDRCFGMLLPPPEFYVNVPEQDHVFHLWEVTDPRKPWAEM